MHYFFFIFHCNFLKFKFRAEKSDVLTEDLLNAEKRVESIKQSCQATQKKIAACQTDFGSETSIEKRMV